MCDVSDPESVATAFAQIAEGDPHLDGLGTAAGISLGSADVVGTSFDTWERTIGVNLTGTFLASRAAVPLLRRGHRSSIVHVASQLALVANAGKSSYVASKGGVLSLSRAMAMDHAAEGIRVNAVRAPPTPRCSGPPLRRRHSPASRER